jgi:hypothetical protein
MLLSAILDVRLPGGGKLVDAAAVGQIVQLEVWALITGNNATGVDDGIQSAAGSFLSTDVGGGAARGTLEAAPLIPFDGLGSSPGTAADLDGDGDLDVGDNDDSGAGLFGVRAGSMVKGGTVAGRTRSMKIADLVFTIEQLLPGTETEINFRPYLKNGAVWMEDNQAQSGISGDLRAGLPVVIRPPQQAGTVRFTTVRQTAVEQGGSINITAELPAPATQNVLVPFVITGTASPGSDYTVPANQIVIPAGSLSGSAVINLVNDTATESTETIVITMGTPVNASPGGITQHLVTILDNDLPTVQFTAVGQSCGENSGTLTVTAQLSASWDREVTIPLTIDGTAMGNGTDYRFSDGPIPLPLVIAPGATTASLAITIVPDGMVEPNETIVISMRTPTNAIASGNTIHTVTIFDATAPLTVQFTASGQNAAETGGAATITAQLSKAWWQDVTVPFTLTGTALGGGTDYTITPSPIVIPAGSTTATITLSIVDDPLSETNETVIVTLGTPTNAQWGATKIHTVTILDNDPAPTVSFTQNSQNATESAGAVAVTVELSAISGANVTVPFTLTGTALGGGTDYTITPSPILIPAGSTTATITLSIVDDPLFETNETVIVTLVTPTNAQLGVTYIHTATILDNDSPPTVRFASAGQNVAEGAGTLNIAVQLSAASGFPISVPFTITGTAAGGADYTVPASPLVVPAGQAGGTITITLLNDTLAEPSETVVLTLGTPTNATLGPVTLHTATILDNEPATVTIADSSVTEGDSGTVDMVFTVSRIGDLSQTITLAYAAIDRTAAAGRDYTSAIGTLTLPANSATTTLRIPIVGDVLDENDETFSINLSSPSPGLSTTRYDFDSGPEPGAMTAADLNGDGRTDIAIILRNRIPPGFTSILINTTAPGANLPTFAARQNVATGIANNGVAAADFNGDGRTDLVTTNLDPKFVSIYLNNTVVGAPTVSFPVKDDFYVGSDPVGLTVGDLNGDGRPDLAVARYGMGGVIVWLNTTPAGSDTVRFAAPRGISTGVSAVSIAMADFNGDGKPDLAVVSQSTNTVSVLLNTTSPGAISPSFATKDYFPTQNNPTFMAVGDLNGDGRLDIAVPNLNSSTVSVLLNTTPPGANTSSFAPTQNLSTAASPIFAAIANFAGDGRPDLIVGSYYDGLSLLPNITPAGADTVTFATRMEYATGLTPESMLADDFNADGFADLAVANGGNNTVSIWLQPASPVVATATGTIHDNDPAPTVSFTAAVQNAAESAGTITVTARLSAPSGLPVTIPFTLGGTAAGGTDYTATASPIAIAPGATEGTIVLTVNDDDVYEPAETVIITMGTPIGATPSGTTVHTATVMDNDTPKVRFVSASQNATEGNAPTITISLDTPMTQSVSVPFTVSGTATAGADFSISSSPLVIGVGATSVSIILNIADDAVYEWDETIVISLGKPVNVALGSPSVHTLTITDNAPTVSFTAPTQAAGEGGGSMTATAVLSIASWQDVTVPFTVSGTASRPADYAITPSPITIPAGLTSGTVTITLVEDTELEADETVVLTMGTPANAAVSGVSVHTATILDNDALSVIVPATSIGGSAFNAVNGFFDISFDLPAHRTASLAGYSIVLAIDPLASGLRLIGAAQAAAAVFPGQIPVVFGAGDRLLVADSLPGIGEEKPIADGAGLIRVLFEAQAGVIGAFGVTIETLELYDANANAIPGLRLVNGRIDVVDVDTTPPAVRDVRIAAGNWNAAFPYAGGHAIPVGSSAQLAPLPWFGLNQLTIAFSEPVSVRQEDLSLRGLNLANYAFSGFAYNPSTSTATWTLGSPITQDKLLMHLSDQIADVAGNRLDGEWTDSIDTYPSGDGLAGTDFNFRLNVLQGDANQDGSVGVSDVLYVRNALFTSAGAPGYSAFYDVNGNGGINIQDVILVRNIQFTTLPAGMLLASAPLISLPLGAVAAAAGGITATIQNAEITADPTMPVNGFVDVLLSVPDGSSPMLAGYETSVLLSSAGSGVVLTGATAANNPVFTGQTLLVFNSTGSRFDITDNLPGIKQETPIVNGSGLFRIKFQVQPGASGVFKINLSGLQLFDGQVRSVPVDQTVGATITVTLDLADNPLLISNSTLQEVESWLKTNRLFSSSKTQHTTLAPFPQPDGSILVKLVYYGDVNHDGAVNLNDYFIIDSNYLAQSPGVPLSFHNGDVNLDGAINLNDYFLIDSAYLGQGSPLSANLASSLAVDSSPDRPRRIQQAKDKSAARRKLFSTQRVKAGHRGRRQLRRPQAVP